MNVTLYRPLKFHGQLFWLWVKYYSAQRVVEKVSRLFLSVCHLLEKKDNFQYLREMKVKA